MRVSQQLMATSVLKWISKRVDGASRYERDDIHLDATSLFLQRPILGSLYLYDKTALNMGRKLAL